MNCHVIAFAGLKLEEVIFLRHSPKAGFNFALEGALLTGSGVRTHVIPWTLTKSVDQLVKVMPRCHAKATKNSHNKLKNLFFFNFVAALASCLT